MKFSFFISSFFFSIGVISGENRLRMPPCFSLLQHLVPRSHSADTWEPTGPAAASDCQSPIGSTGAFGPLH